MIGSLLPTILWDINEKSAKLMEKNLQVDNYQLDFKEFETSLQENLLQQILRTSFIKPTKF